MFDAHDSPTCVLAPAHTSRVTATLKDMCGLAAKTPDMLSLGARIVQPSTWLVTALVVFVSAALQAVTGFGFALICVPLLLMFLPPQVSVTTSMMISLCCLGLLSYRNRRNANMGIVKWLTVGSLAGVPLGLYMLTHADVGSIKSMASIVTLLIAVYYVLRPSSGVQRSEVAATRERATRGAASGRTLLYLAAGSVSGFLTTGVGMPGPPVVLALSGTGLKKHEFRATSVTFFVVVYCISLVTFGLSNVLTAQTAIFVASLLPFAILGNTLGDRVFGYVPQATFDRAVPLLLMATAVSNILKR